MKRLKRTIIVYAIVTLLVLIIGFVYNTFLGHGVTSSYMAHAYFFPLFGGLLVNALLLTVQKRLPFVGTVGYRAFNNTFGGGIATLCVYSILKGALEIASADSGLLVFLLIIGCAAVAVSLILMAVLLLKVRQALIRQARAKRKQQRSYTQDAQ